MSKKIPLYKRLLLTKDGRKVGNAICHSLGTEPKLTVIVDDGTKVAMTYREVEEAFWFGPKAPPQHRHYYGLPGEK